MYKKGIITAQLEQFPSKSHPHPHQSYYPVHQSNPTMRLILSSLATAALALVASAAPAVEQTKDLPARFKMYMVTKDSHTNGLRVQYNNGESSFYQ